jgi:hypothetical protein
MILKYVISSQQFNRKSFRIHRKVTLKTANDFPLPLGRDLTQICAKPFFKRQAVTRCFQKSSMHINECVSLQEESIGIS